MCPIKLNAKTNTALVLNIPPLRFLCLWFQNNFRHHSLLPSKCLTPQDLNLEKARQTLPCPIDAPGRPPNHRMTSLQSLYARRAHSEFASTRGGSLPSRLSVASSPWRAAPRQSQTLQIPQFPSLYLSPEETTRRYVRNCRASKRAS